MKFFRKTVAVLLLLAIVAFFSSILRDKVALSENLVRLHVIADSDAPADQEVKLKVRDAVLKEVSRITQGVQNKEQAMQLLTGVCDRLEQVANTVLQEQGFTQTATVELGQEAYPTRHYDTFSLPAGVYDSLRVTIGAGEGKNWWCVVFPQLCLPAASEDVTEVAASAGWSENLGNTLTGKEGYEVRFFLLDCIGWVEKFFWEL